MEDFITENWLGFLGIISAPVAWIFGGKQAKGAELKNVNGEFLTKVQGIYDGLVDDLKSDRDALKESNILQNVEIKENRDGLKLLQKQFNDLYLSYAKEVEASKYWKDKFDLLETKYLVLEKDHEILKKSFESYKKENL